MFQTPKKYMKFLTVIFALAGGFGSALMAQVSSPIMAEVEVPIIQQFGLNRYRCYMENQVIDEAMLKRIASATNLREDCAVMYKSLNVDFAKQTLISYRSGGDCFLRVTARVFRNDEEKKYTVRIKNLWGGCRAGGSFQGWLVIEKVPENYKVEFAETRVMKVGNQEVDEDVFDLNSFSAQDYKSASEVIEPRSINLKNCIETIYTKRFVIRDEETYLNTIRKDASRDYCLKNLEKIDFSRYTLIGIEINSGYCRVPIGLVYQIFKNEAKKQFLLSINYIDPGREVCRALSQYDLWILAPKLPPDYEVRFEITARPGVRNSLLN